VASFWGRGVLRLVPMAPGMVGTHLADRNCRGSAAASGAERLLAPALELRSGALDGVAGAVGERLEVLVEQ